MGKLIKPTQFVYQGEFTNNKITGFGTIDYENGESFTGNFNNGKYNGYGELKNTSGQIISGNF